MLIFDKIVFLEQVKYLLRYYVCMAKHTSVALPEALQQAVKNTIAAHPELGYTSIAEFCKDAIRSKIAEVEQRTAK